MRRRLAALTLLLVASALSGGPVEDAQAAYDLGDYAAAMQLCLPLAEKGNAEAQYNVGRMYFKGEGVAQEYAEAKKWWLQAATQGLPIAQYCLGLMYADGQGVAQDYLTAAFWFRGAANQGNVHAQAALGYLYYNGLGLACDYVEAAKWYRKAAEQGVATAQSDLGLMYELGRGVSQDYTEAVKWYRKAAEQGEAFGQLRLGLMYYEGRGGVPRLYTEAARLYKLSAEQGNPFAQLNLAWSYLDGKGVPQNRSEGIRSYELATQQDWLLASFAQTSLGNIYAKASDYANAIRCYNLAADRGWGEAQLNLGDIYAEGRGVPQDLAEAHKWYNLAAASNYFGAAARRDGIAAKMTQEQLAEAEKRALVWKPWTHTVNITVATDATWPPMEFVNGAKEIVGFDIDLMKAAAKAGGFQVEFKNTAWDGIFAGLANGEYDAVISSVTITEERKQTMDFSVPYINAGQVLVVRSDSRAAKLANLTGKNVGAQIGTTGAVEVEKVKGVTLKTYDELGLAIEDLSTARIDAVVCDSPIAANYVLQNPTYRGRLKIVGQPFTQELYGVAVRKGNTKALEEINAGLRKVLESPEYQRIKTKWLP